MSCLYDKRFIPFTYAELQSAIDNALNLMSKLHIFNKFALISRST